MQGQVRALPCQLRGAAALGPACRRLAPGSHFKSCLLWVRVWGLYLHFFCLFFPEGGLGIYILRLYLILRLMLLEMFTPQNLLIYGNHVTWEEVGDDSYLSKVSVAKSAVTCGDHGLWSSGLSNTCHQDGQEPQALQWLPQWEQGKSWPCRGGTWGDGGPTPSTLRCATAETLALS